VEGKLRWLNSWPNGGFGPWAATTLVEIEMEDHELLRQYAEEQSEDAFAELVSRHIDLVYSAALRLVRDVRGNPVEGAVVGIPPGTRDSVKTDAQGRFSFNLKTKWALQIEPNPESVISKRAFTQPYIFVRDSQNNRAGIVGLGNPTKKKTITLLPGLTIAGRVVNEDRTGINGVNVIFSLSPTGTVWDAYFADSTVTTDEQGQYQIHGLPILSSGYYGIHVRWAPGKNGNDWVGQIRINGKEGEFAEAEDRHSSTRWPTKIDANGQVAVQDIVVAQQRAQFR
jgi:hypothetical protein